LNTFLIFCLQEVGIARVPTSVAAAAAQGLGRAAGRGMFNFLFNENYE
jgi:hypothetical protein